MNLPRLSVKSCTFGKFIQGGDVHGVAECVMSDACEVKLSTVKKNSRHSLTKRSEVSDY